ncbi:NUDIX domain-containing protein [Bacillus sp. JCM 19041]|uniref:NUDIX hydrolase n=1 Tax=Bacillus sp. JCM 19041 TaxID=1460637 RepID=UPI0006CFE7AD
MQSEVLTIYNRAKQPIGTADREKAHTNGLWHETFHCWILDDTAEEPMLYLQRRSDTKKEFSSLFDITAAGHLLSHEKTEDGIREIKEELGISILLSDLHFIGQFRCIPNQVKIIDREFASTYVYTASLPFEAFSLQEEEVAGIVRVPFREFFALCFRSQTYMSAEGFIETNGYREHYKNTLSLTDLVPHSLTFLQQIALAINELIQERKE